MGQIGDQEFRDALITMKKDAKLVAAAKNDRTNSFEWLYKEFSALTIDRQCEIICSISASYFVGAQWKIAFPLTNFPAAIQPDAVRAAGKVLFFSRDEDAVRESVRAIKLYQDSPFLKQILSILSESAEVAGVETGMVAAILTAPELFGMIGQLEGVAAGERIVQAIGKVAMLTRNRDAALRVASLLQARRFSSSLPQLAALVEDSIFMVRDRKSVQQILHGFSSGPIDVAMQKASGDKRIIGAIRDVAWKTRDAASIRSFLASV
jgi:hypothetical protein